MYTQSVYGEMSGNQALAAGGVFYVDTTTSTPNLAELLDMFNSLANGTAGKNCPIIFNVINESIPFSNTGFALTNPDLPVCLLVVMKRVA